MPAIIQHFSNRRLFVVRTVCVFWLIGKIMTWKLWVSQRIFPLIPPFGMLHAPASFHLFLLLLSLTLLAALVFFPGSKVLLVALIFSETLSCLLDQNRWQPWEFEYLMMMFALWINLRKEKAGLEIIAFIMVCVYFYSGIQKINDVFSSGSLALIERWFGRPLPHGGIPGEFLTHLGYALGSMEALSAVGLLFSTTRKIAAALLMVMHFFIIALFGPWGFNYDLIIIPWNMAFLVLLGVLFWKTPSVSLSAGKIYGSPNRFFILLFGVLPVLNFFGLWDYFLSSSLFSFKAPELFIYIHNTGDAKPLRPYYAITRNVFSGGNLDTIINVRSWAFKELGAPAYPEKRIYSALKQELSRKYPQMKATYVIRFYQGHQQVTANLP